MATRSGQLSRFYWIMTDLVHRLEAAQAYTPDSTGGLAAACRPMLRVSLRSRARSQISVIGYVLVDGAK